jgi:dihydroorotase/N-acyl-D-amino-acid deacylase
VIRTRRIATMALVVGVLACTSKTAPPRGAATPAASDASYDVVISNGRIVDGSGNSWYYGDVGIKGDRIARITPTGMLQGAHAGRRIDATGLVVAPGIIDIQGQSVYQLTVGDGRVVSKVTQGVTTEILGEGDTPAPTNAKFLANAGPDTSAMYKAMTTFGGAHGFDAWLTAMERHGGSINMGSFLGAATVRQYAKGQAMGTANGAELDTMRAVVRRAMSDGAFGVASALIYPPGAFANTDELVEEAKAMSPYGGVYITHMRSEGNKFVEAVDEALEIGRRGKVPVEIYHLKASGTKNWPKMATVIAKIDSARAAGQDVGADQYAYVAGSNGLASCIPEWATADGKLIENLQNPQLLPKIRDGIVTEDPNWESVCQLAGPENVMLIGFTQAGLKQYEGKRLSEISKSMGKSWQDAVIDLTVAEKGNLGQVIFLMSEQNIPIQMQQPWMKFGTDADGWDPDSATSMTHPRAYGNYPRILGRYVREQHALTLEDAVRKMTSAVATRLSIRDRGLIVEGMYADVMVFDPATIIDNATFEKPHQISTGVRYVLVNGVAVVNDGKHTGAKPGRALRGPGWKKSAA